MGTSASIIIGFTPFHLLPMRELVTLVQGDIHIFHPMADRQAVGASAARVSFLGNCDSSRRSRWAKVFAARRDIERLLRDTHQVDLYVSHPFYPLANHVFFHPRVRNRFIYQDGILNYYDAPVPLGTAWRRMGRRVKATAIGARFRMYGGHLSGIDAVPMAGGFFTHPDRIVSAGKFPAVQRLDFRRDVVDAKSPDNARHDTLFLDQPIDSIVGKDAACELRRRTIDYTNTLGGRVLYKPHYTQRHPRPCDPAWVPLDSVLNGLPAEWAVEQLNLAHVVSFCTSALANIAMCDSTIACHATAAKLIAVSVDGRPTDLGEVLSGLGVQVVDPMDR